MRNGYVALQIPFADPSIAEFMADAGASGLPVVEFYEAIESEGVS